MPEFTFVNVMGHDAVIFPDSVAVYDLDIVVPAGVDYPDFNVSNNLVAMKC